MIILKLDGVSNSKIILTIFLWLSLSCPIYFFFKYFAVIKIAFPRGVVVLLLMVLTWHIICVFKSFLFRDGSVNTLLGNIYTGLAFLTPVFMVFSVDIFNALRLEHFYIKLLKLGAVCFCVFFIVGLGKLSLDQNRILSILLLPVTFLLVHVFNLKRSDKILVFFTAVMLALSANVLGNRAMLIRLLLLLVFGVALLLYKKRQNKFYLRISFLVVLVPFFLLSKSIYSDTSAIQEYISEVQDKKLNTDTRTFLYIEVFNDIIKNDKLLFGKGANGKYYSKYFSHAKGDDKNRLSVEVGVLCWLLKGGLVSVILNLALLILAIYYAFFRSNNYHITAIGFVLLVHLLLLFIENIISFSIYNILIWICIGICCSKQFRSFDTNQMHQFLNLKIK